MPFIFKYKTIEKILPNAFDLFAINTLRFGSTRRYMTRNLKA